LFAATMLFAACSSTGGATTAPSEAAPSGAAPSAEPMADLVAAAQAEGTLTTIALPHDWCNYGEVIETFKSKYSLEVNELDPNAGSGDEIEAIKANKDNPGPQAPDVIDVGLSFGPSAKEEGLLAPYKVVTGTRSPMTPDADGYWWGDTTACSRSGQHGGRREYRTGQTS
jgi:putative spermidine/putrescine transport system substrate-binding protein